MKSCKAAIAAMAAVFAFSALSVRAHAQAPSDPQIVGIVVSANQIDIDYAKLALKKSKNKAVREFAQQMVTDHTAVQDSVFALGKKLNVTPADSETAKGLKDQAEKTTQHLQSLSGKAFDKAYIDNEIGYHQAVIDAVSTVLIPNAKNSELKSALTGAGPLFQGHLEHAKQVQADLNNDTSKTRKHSQAPANAAKHSKTHTIVIDQFKFQPGSAVVNKGDTVEWKNEGVVPHNVVAADRSFDSGTLPKGASGKWVASKKGTFAYMCTLHPNMKATLTVR